MNNEKEIDEFLQKAGALGSVPGLENIRNLMGELGDIQDELSVIHVAGTNGKGSTGAMIEAILMQAGFGVGRYSSPGVFNKEEQFQMNGRAIFKEELQEVLKEVAQACKRLTERGLSHPTIFEVETAAAFLWFYQKKCRAVIIETGMGGRLDATNIIRKPLCSVITSISMDHMGFLGDTLEEIAAQKAGIIKEGCPVVTGKQQPEAEAVLRQECNKQQGDLQIADTNAIANIRYQGEYLIFDWGTYRDIKLSLLGAYQPENAVIAIKTIECIKEQGFEISKEAIREGLSHTKWPGRFQMIGREPLVVIDGAHNEDAAKKLRKTLEMGFTNRKIIYIIGVLADKEYDKILSEMLPLAEKVYTVTPQNARALSGELLREAAKKYHEDVSSAPDIPTALKWALADAKEDPEAMILAFGSLSYLGEFSRAME